jgi:sulfatase maturation enzyme AslB (radical SAM superfamily)
MDGLPIFRCDCDGYAAFYAPGCLCVAGLAAAERFQAMIAPHPVELDSSTHWAAELWNRAELAVTQANRRVHEPFRPECLTLYMNNECNLSCVYCHTDPSRRPGDRLSLKGIAAAAQVVAESCRQKGHTFYAVVHGGGEPTLHRDRVESALAIVQASAAESGVDLFRYVATNGVMPEVGAAWLAHRFDLIGLSCDGPDGIHDRQRPRWNGQGTGHIVRCTAHILHEEGAHLHVRATITPAAMGRQAEIAEYICRQLAPEEIHFEPVYLGGRTDGAEGFDAAQADEFAASFLEARRVAQSYGIPLIGSGSRLGTIHGPYCHVFRDVVNLVPGSIATACFKLTGSTQIQEKGAAIGGCDRQAGHFEIDHDRVQVLRGRLGVSLPDCDGCFNHYHCARQCPDHCPLDDRVSREPGFRCRVQKAISLALLRETADRLWSVVLSLHIKDPHGTAIL